MPHLKSPLTKPLCTFASISCLCLLSLAPSTSIASDTVPVVFSEDFTSVDHWEKLADGKLPIIQNDAENFHSPYLQTHNSLLQCELGFPLRQSFELTAKVKLSGFQQALWIGSFDAAGKQGYSALWDSSNAAGKGFLNISKHEHSSSLKDWQKNGSPISKSVTSPHQVSDAAFATLSLRWQRTTGKLTLSMNGKVLAQANDKSFTSFSKIYLKAHGEVSFDDVTLTTGQDSELVTLHHLFNQGSLHTGASMLPTALDASWKTLSGKVLEQQAEHERVVHFAADHSRAQTPLPQHGSIKDYPLLTINYDIRKTTTSGNGGGVYLVNRKGAGIGFITELAEDKLNRSTLKLVSTSDSGKTHTVLSHKTWHGVQGSNFHSIAFTWNRNSQQVTATIDQEKAQDLGALTSGDINLYSRLILANQFKNTLQIDNLILIRVPAGAVNVLDHGAVADGTSATPTNNLASFTAAIAAAKQDKLPVYVPSGVFGYDDVIPLDGVTMIGSGATSVLMSQNEEKSAIRLMGDSPSLIGCNIQGNATVRSSQPHTTGVWIFHANNFMVSANRVHNIGSAGIFAFKSSQGYICGNIVTHTYADGIHHTATSNLIQTNGNAVFFPGDDQIAVVSYKGMNKSVEGKPVKGSSHCHDIEAFHNYTYGQAHARGMTVVGGKRITYGRNQVNHAQQAGIYINAEPSYNTWDWQDIIITENVIRNSGMSHVDDIEGNETNQAGIFISANPDSLSSNLIAKGNQIYHSHYRGIAIGYSCSDILIEQNLIDTTASSALHLTAAHNVTLVENKIYRAGKYGIFADKNSSGFLKIRKNLLVDVNRSNKESFIDVILILAESHLSSLEIIDNHYDNPAGYLISRLIENHTTAAKSSLKNNTTSTTAKVWQAP
ncbi:MAG: right-handed parallel beta-helix repeat-containing protein [Verrucomicrobiales bacterium]|nr:right-handed parallel beta-helix repeat-containing protein [Verrucomicrobiales bacterium]